MKRLHRSQEINLTITARKIKKDWLSITLKRLKNELSQRGINDTNTLLNSVEGSMGTDVIYLQYMMYGKFVDMNVGRGRGLERNAEKVMMDRLMAQMMGKRPGRRQKKHQWYSRRMGKEQYKLGILLADMYGQAGTDAILQAMPKVIELKM
jgi:hypothetical protein